MGQKRFSQILGATVAIALLTALVGGVHAKIKAAIAAQTDNRLCEHPASQSFPCYSVETVLTPQPTTAIATDPGGTWLASSNRATIDLWNLETGQRVRSLQGHTQWITALAFSPNGRILASGSLDGTINLWELPTGRLRTTLFARHVTVLAFSPDGSTLASGSRLITSMRPKSFHPMQFWDVGEGRLLINIAMQEPVTAIAFSPDGQRLAAGSSQASVWDVPTQTRLYSVNAGDLSALIFSQDGRLLLTGGEGIRGEDGIKMWDAATGKLVRVVDSVASDFALSADGSLLISTYGGNANLWRMQPFGYLDTLRGSTYSGLVAEFGLGTQAIATGSSDGVKVFKPPTRR